LGAHKKGGTNPGPKGGGTFAAGWDKKKFKGGPVGSVVRKTRSTHHGSNPEEKVGGPKKIRTPPRKEKGESQRFRF